MMKNEDFYLADFFRHTHGLDKASEDRRIVSVVEGLTLAFAFGLRGLL